MINVYLDRPWVKNYDTHVPANVHFDDTCFCESWDRIVQAFAHKPAVWYMGRALSFKDLDRYANRLAHYLKSRGLGRGDVVALNLPNIPAHYIAVLAVQKARCISTGVSMLLDPQALLHQLQDSGARMVITLDIFYEKICEIAPQTGIETIVVSSAKDFLPKAKLFWAKMFKKIPEARIKPLSGVQVRRFLAAISKAPEAAPQCNKDMDHTMFIMYTGATTGVAKGVPLTQRNCMENIQQVQTWMDLSPADSFLCSFPLFHIAGLSTSLTAMLSGITQIAVPNAHDTGFLIEALRRYKPSSLIHAAMVYMELMKNPEFARLDFSGIAWCLSAVQPFAPEHIKAFESFVGQGKLIELYGMTETSPVTCCSPRYGRKKPGSIGMPLPNTFFQIVDPLSSEPVALGEVGEILISGPQVFTLGYSNQPNETIQTMRRGWMYTGDMGRMDEDGYFYLVDRLKDTVIVSGFQVFTRELDDELAGHPDIDIAATVGVPDPLQTGVEQVVSVVVLKKGVEQSALQKEKILAYLSQRIASYQLPKDIVFMEELPSSEVGRVLKSELRHMLTAH